MAVAVVEWQWQWQWQSALTVAVAVGVDGGSGSRSQQCLVAVAEVARDDSWREACVVVSGGSAAASPERALPVSAVSPVCAVGLLYRHPPRSCIMTWVPSRAARCLPTYHPTIADTVSVGRLFTHTAAHVRLIGLVECSQQCMYVCMYVNTTTHCDPLLPTTPLPTRPQSRTLVHTPLHSTPPHSTLPASRRHHCTIRHCHGTQCCTHTATLTPDDTLPSTPLTVTP